MQKLPMRVPLYKDTGYQLSHAKPACLIPTAKVGFIIRQRASIHELKVTNR